jgi:hypothetical protein
MAMSRIASIVALFLVACCTVALGAAAPANPPKDAPAAQVKDGIIKTVDADGKGFILTRDPRPLPFKIDDKTVITLDGKASTFAEAVKPDLKAKVTYTKPGDDRVASKVEVTTGAVAPAAPKADAPAPQVKDGTIKSVDADGKGFILTRDPRPLPFKIDDKTIITLDGKASTFAAAVKPDLKAKVTYTKPGDDRVASKVEVTSGEAK